MECQLAALIVWVKLCVLLGGGSIQGLSEDPQPPDPCQGHQPRSSSPAGLHRPLPLDPSHSCLTGNWSPFGQASWLSPCPAQPGQAAQTGVVLGSIFYFRTLHGLVGYSFLHLLWVTLMITYHFYNESIFKRVKKETSSTKYGYKSEFSVQLWVSIFGQHCFHCTKRKDQALVHHREYVIRHNLFRKKFCSLFQHFNFVCLPTKRFQSYEFILHVACKNKEGYMWNIICDGGKWKIT